MTTHEVKFEFHPGRKIYRVKCNCGWFDIDDKLEPLQARAATHDLEWEEVKPGGQNGEGKNIARE